MGVIAAQIKALINEIILTEEKRTINRLMWKKVTIQMLQVRIELLDRIMNQLKKVQNA